MPPAVKFRIGDRVIVPWRTHRHGTEVIGGWADGVVTAIRGRDHLIVRSYQYERVHPAYEVRRYPTRRSEWP